MVISKEPVLTSQEDQTGAGGDRQHETFGNYWKWESKYHWLSLWSGPQYHWLIFVAALVRIVRAGFADRNERLMKENWLAYSEDYVSFLFQRKMKFFLVLQYDYNFPK